MADVELKFDSAEAKKFLSDITNGVRSVAKLKKAFVDAVGANVYADIIDHFEKEEGQDGKWQAWSEIYAERMKATGKGGNKILQDTGRLRNSISANKRRIVTDGIEWYSNIEYAARHNDGLSGMPQREFMWLSDSRQDAIAEIALAFATGERK